MTEKKKSPAKGKPRKGTKKAAGKAAKKAPAKKAARKALKKTPVKPKAKAVKKPRAKGPKKAAKKPVAAPVYEHVFDNPKNVKRAIHTLFAVCGLALILDFFVSRHVDHPWEGLFGFYALYGFVACMILVLVAKELRKVLMRGEDYYDG